MHPVTTASSRVCRRTAIPAEAMKMTRSTLARHQRDTALSLPDIAARVASLDWPGSGRSPRRARLRHDRRRCDAGRMRGAAATSTAPTSRSAAASSWRGMGSAAASTSISPTRCPTIVAALRTALYPPLAEIANRWNEAMGIAVRYPAEHAAFLARCHAAGQTQADAAAAAVRRGRLQLPAPGRLRRARLPAAGRLPAVAARRAISPAASSSSPSSARACSRAPRSCRCGRARP